MRDLIIVIANITAAFCFVLLILMDVSDKDIINANQKLTNTDTIHKQITNLEIVSDTIRIYYEKKVENYRILTTPERVKLFTKRISK